MSSKTPHITGTKLKPHHGTMTSYVIGFILSLICTFIPYYLVVNQTLSKNALLATILGFAVAQMMIQVLFFLHLGREKKPHWNALFLASTVGIILVVVGGSIWIMNNLHYNMAGMQVVDKIAADEAVHEIDGVQAGTCPAGTGTNHKIMLMDNMATPDHIDAHLCDTLTFMNHDDVTRQINFGVHHKHTMYAGQEGKVVDGHHNESIRLTEPGTHTFHDHKDDQIHGDFTVSQ